MPQNNTIQAKACPALGVLRAGYVARLADNYQGKQAHGRKKASSKPQEALKPPPLAYQRGEVARAVYEARERLGLSRSALAQKVGVGYEVIQDLELGRLTGRKPGPAKRVLIWLRAQAKERKGKA